MAAPTKDIVVITHPAEHGVPRPDPEGGPVPPHTRLQLANRARPFRRWARLHYAYEQLPAAEPGAEAEVEVLDRQAAAAAAGTEAGGATRPPEELQLQHAATRLLDTASPRREQAEPRRGVLCAFHPDWQWAHGLEVARGRRLPPLPPECFQPAPGRCRTVRLELSSLRLSLTQGGRVLEPMQLVVSLYHRTAERRASESAVVHISPSSDPLPFLCQFRVWDCVSDHMILVCRLHKVISGSAGVKERHYGEERARTKTADEKTLLRLSDKAKLWASKFEDYRSPLAIGVQRLSSVLGAAAADIQLHKWKSHEDGASEEVVVRAMLEMLDGSGEERKPIGHVDTRLVAPEAGSTHCRRCTKACASSDPQKLSYSEGDVIQVLASHDVGWWIGQLGGYIGLFREGDTEPCEVDPSPHSSVLDATACLQTFRTGAKEPARSVSGFSNTLYVYPQALRLPKSKNVALRVRLCDVLDGRTNPIADKSFSRWDDQADDEGSVRSASESYLTCVQTKAKVANFTDEVRIDLPIVEDPRQYLVFTVLHINMQKPSRAGGGGCCSAPSPEQGRMQRGDVETELGHAALPLYGTDIDRACMIDDGCYRLEIREGAPVFGKEPHKIDANSGGAGTKKPEPESMSLDVRVQNLTTIHATHSLTQQLLIAHAACVKSPDDGTAIQQAKAIVQTLSQPAELEQAGSSLEFRSFADALFAFLGLADKELSTLSFRCLVALVAHVSGEHHRHNTVAWYVHHLNTFDSGSASAPLHDTLCELLADWVACDEAKSSANSLWFFFEIVIASILNMGITSDTADACPQQTKEHFSGDQVHVSEDAMIQLTRAVAALVKKEGSALSTELLSMRQLNTDFALLTKDLLSVSSSGQSVFLEYMDQLRDCAEMVEVKWDYIAVVADHEHSVALKLPAMVSQAAVQAVKSDDAKESEVALKVLAEILTKHSWDSKAASTEFSRAEIASAYFRFVLGVIDEVPDTHWSKPGADADILAIVLFVIQSLGEQALFSWLTRECDRRIRVLLRLLETIVTRFECPGRREVLNGPVNVSRRVTALHGGESDPKAALEAMHSRAQQGFARMKSRDETPTPSLDERLDIVQKYEASVSEEFHLTVLVILTKLMQIEHLDGLFSSICRVIVSIIGRRRISMLVGLESMRCLDMFLHVFAQTIFSPAFTAGKEMAFAVLSLCSTGRREYRPLREQAALVLYHYVQLSLEMEGVAVVNGQLTRALASLCNSLADDSGLQNSLELLMELARQGSDKSVHADVAALSDRLRRILSASAQLRETDDVDAPKKVELYEELIEAYSGAKDLSLSWCVNQACFHRDHGNHAEAGAGFVKAACMLAMPLEQAGAIQAGTRELLLQIIPWHVPNDMFDGKTADPADRRLMIDYIEQAASQYKDGGLFETAVLVYKVQTHILADSLDYSALAVLHGHIRSMYQLAMAAESGQARMLGTYYRVGFYGKLFGALDRKEFVYKMPKITRLVEVTDSMLSLWKRQVDDGQEIKVVSTSHAVDPDTLDGPHLQITQVKPDVDDDSDRLTTHFHQNSNVSSFVFESPFTRSGGLTQSSIDEQWVRRTVLAVATPFPCTRLRQEVVASESSETAPIANSIDIVHRRAAQIRKAANLEAALFSDTVQMSDVGPNRNVLEQELLGSLLLQVHGGALEVATAFLQPTEQPGAVPEPEPEPEPDSDSEQKSLPEPEPEPEPEGAHEGQLRDALSDFLSACQESLAVYATVASSQELLLELQRGLDTLTEQMKRFDVVLTVPRRGSVSRGTVSRGTVSRGTVSRGTLGRGTITMGRLSQLDDVDASPVLDLSIEETLQHVEASVEELRPGYATARE